MLHALGAAVRAQELQAHVFGVGETAEK